MCWSSSADFNLHSFILTNTMLILMVWYDWDEIIISGTQWCSRITLEPLGTYIKAIINLLQYFSHKFQSRIKKCIPGSEEYCKERNSTFSALNILQSAQGLILWSFDVKLILAIFSIFFIEAANWLHDVHKKLYLAPIATSYFALSRQKCITLYWEETD